MIYHTIKNIRVKMKVFCILYQFLVNCIAYHFTCWIPIQYLIILSKTAVMELHFTGNKTTRKRLP